MCEVKAARRSADSCGYPAQADFRGEQVAKQSKYEQIVEELLTPIAEEKGVRIYDVDYTREGPDYYLRCYIDKDGGVNIGDCENVSRALSDALDEADPIPDAYILEVSSPGLGRSLTKDRHFAASLDEKVEGTTFRPYKGKKKSFEGILKSFDAGTVTIETDGPGEEDEAQLVLERDNIASIRLVVEF